jgi:hypothetical protein
MLETYGQAIMTAKRVVVVLGMHRSGTSLLAGALGILGVCLGSRLIQGDANNEEGYFEHEVIVGLHKRLQAILDRRWTGPKGSLDYPDGWSTRADVREIEAQLRKTVSEEIGKALGLWGFKDPRTTRLLAMWRRIFAELGVEPVYFLSVRNPMAVAASVARRDDLSTGRAQLLWLQHNLDALRDLKDQSLHIVDYDQWFTDLGGQVHRIASALSMNGSAERTGVHERVSGLVHKGMRHHKGESGASIRLVRELYSGLAEASATGTIPESVWRLEAEFAEAKHLLGGWSELIEGLVDPRARSTARPVRDVGTKIARLMGAVRRGPSGEMES